MLMGLALETLLQIALVDHRDQWLVLYRFKKRNIITINRFRAIHQKKYEIGPVQGFLCPPDAQFFDFFYIIANSCGIDYTGGDAVYIDILFDGVSGGSGYCGYQGSFLLQQTCAPGLTDGTCRRPERLRLPNLRPHSVA